MTRLILVRHGRTVLNAEDRLRGLADPELDDVGVAQAQSAAELIVRAAPSAVWTSPLDRAVRTGHIVATVCGVEQHSDARLNDRDYGRWTGVLRSEVIERFGQIDSAPGVEPRADVLARSWPAVEDAARSSDDGPVVLVSHDAVLRPILEAIAGTAIPEPIAPGSCHIIAVDGGRWSIEAFDWGSPSGH
ncbi:histidine phosphatase family protein [Williamsia serinedens]|uniref:Phosphoglycerate mutase n=1 Tax=Williamsia serinedens TaxID=391736 RepID=A0ABT1H4U2_9NOCA|nr:histidine phosphatase family protein [Williamsia serinedens]MCP2162254.1 putative phosphoglycerate mutase [Williamsia serinedens]